MELLISFLISLLANLVEDILEKRYLDKPPGDNYLQRKHAQVLDSLIKKLHDEPTPETLDKVKNALRETLSEINLFSSLQEILSNQEELKKSMKLLLSDFEANKMDILDAVRNAPNSIPIEITNQYRFEFHRDSLLAATKSAVLEKYLAAVKEKHAHLDMIDLHRQLPLEEIYVRLKLVSDSNQQVEVKLESALENKRVVILGDPGAGKTTLLKYLAYRSACNYEDKEIIPIFVRLTDLSNRFNCNFDRFLNQLRYRKYATLLQEKIQSGKCLMLLDGLDEVNRENWNSIRSEVESLSDSDNQVVLTCRKVAYTRGFISKSEEYEILGFDKEQQRQFIENFFRDAPEKAEALSTALDLHPLPQLWRSESDKRMQEIMETPLLLSFTVVLYDNGKLQLPINRVELYEKTTDFLMQGWNDKRDPGKGNEFESEDKRDFLAKLAFDYFQNNLAFYFRNNEETFKRRDLLNRIREWQQTHCRLEGKREKLLDELSVHNGILVREEDYYHFLHQTFQEFFTAKYIASDHHRIQQLITNHQRSTGYMPFFDVRCREIFILIAGIMDKADNLLIAMEDEIQKFIRNSSTLQKLFHWAYQLTDGSESKLNPVAKRATAISHANASASIRDITNASVRSIVRAIGMVSYIDIDIDIDIENIIRSTINLDLDLDIETGINIDIDRDNPSVRPSDSDIDSTSASIRILDSAKIFKDVSFDELLVQLEKVKNQKSIDIKDVEAIYWAWSNALKLTPEMIDDLSEEWKTLRHYLAANYFLIQCKDAAARVSPEVWQGIEARMLTVPQ